MVQGIQMVPSGSRYSIGTKWFKVSKRCLVVQGIQKAMDQGLQIYSSGPMYTKGTHWFGQIPCGPRYPKKWSKVSKRYLVFQGIQKVPSGQCIQKVP